MKYRLCWESPDGIVGRGNPISKKLADKLITKYTERSKNPPASDISDMRGYEHWLETVEE